MSLNSAGQWGSIISMDIIEYWLLLCQELWRDSDSPIYILENPV